MSLVHHTPPKGAGPTALTLIFAVYVIHLYDRVLHWLTTTKGVMYPSVPFQGGGIRAAFNVGAYRLLMAFL